MSTERSIILPAVDSAGRGLQASFFRYGDRFAHSIAALDGDRLTPILASIEGSETDDWPPSPPLQEVHVEQRGSTGHVVLAVGRSGSSHWSLSLHAESTAGGQAAPGPALVFDLAVRLQSAPPRVGSAYRSMVEAAESSSDSLELNIDKQRFSVTTLATRDTKADMITTAEGIVISVAEAKQELTTSTEARTIRWVYRVACLA